MRQLLGTILLLAVCGFYGCEYEPAATLETAPETSSESAEGAGGTETAASEAADAESEAKTDAEEEEVELEFDSETTGGDEPNVTVKKAEAGVTHKGEFAQSSNNPMSIITVPLATYFTAKEMAVFNMQIPSAMNLYKATNGENPKTEEVFMKDIIEANQIHLPELKEGDEYFYDPETAELMVRSKE